MPTNGAHHSYLFWLGEALTPEGIEYTTIQNSVTHRKPIRLFPDKTVETK